MSEAMIELPERLFLTPPQCPWITLPLAVWASIRYSPTIAGPWRNRGVGTRLCPKAALPGEGPSRPQLPKVLAVSEPIEELVSGGDSRVARTAASHDSEQESRERFPSRSLESGVRCEASTRLLLARGAPHARASVFDELPPRPVLRTRRRCRSGTEGRGRQSRRIDHGRCGRWRDRRGSLRPW